MSYSFDVLHDAILLLDGDAELKLGVRNMVDALHQINHDQKDALNFNNRVRRLASIIEKRILLLEAGK